MMDDFLDLDFLVAIVAFVGEINGCECGDGGELVMVFFLLNI